MILGVSLVSRIGAGMMFIHKPGNREKAARHFEANKSLSVYADEARDPTSGRS